jgi:hypothetical protein
MWTEVMLGKACELGAGLAWIPSKLQTPLSVGARPVPNLVNLL